MTFHLSSTGIDKENEKRERENDSVEGKVQSINSKESSLLSATRAQSTNSVALCSRVLLIFYEFCAKMDS